MSLSSWERELYAAASTGIEVLRLQSGLRDFGYNTVFQHEVPQNLNEACQMARSCVSK